MNAALALRHQVTGPPAHSLCVTATVAWLNANDRGGWYAHSGTIKAWREMTGWAVRRARIGPMRKAYILAELRFTRANRRDPNNWAPTVKACVDGLVDCGVLADDNADHLIGPDLRIGPLSTAANGLLILHIWPVT